MNQITVVSLGPGPREYLTLGALSALEKAEKLVYGGGLGHTASIYIDEEKAKERLDAFCAKM